MRTKNRVVQSWKMTLDSPVTFFALAIPPIVALVFVCLIWFRRDPVSQPSIVAAIPLALTSISILLGESAAVLLATFNEIATGKSAGIRAVVAGLLRAQRPISWGFLDFAACLIVIFLTCAILRYSSDAETPLIQAYLSLPALIATAAVVVTLFLMVYLQYSTVDLVMMIVDNHRNQEVVSKYGTVSPAYFAARISSRLVATFFLSIAEFLGLIVAGVFDLFWRQKQDSRPAFAAVLTLGALIGCGVSALSEFGFVDYLLYVPLTHPLR